MSSRRVGFMNVEHSRNEQQYSGGLGSPPPSRGSGGLGSPLPSRGNGETYRGRGQFQGRGRGACRGRGVSRGFGGYRERGDRYNLPPTAASNGESSPGNQKSDSDDDGDAAGNQAEKTLRLRTKLIRQLSRETYECTVCCDDVKQHHAVWSCKTCYACFHLNCVKRWSVKSRRESDNNTWQCPICRNELAADIDHYRCFCGKVSRPQTSISHAPHSCGQTCELDRNILVWCPHICTITCHPGPCPPCTSAKCGEMRNKTLLEPPTVDAEVVVAAGGVAMADGMDVPHAQLSVLEATTQLASGNATPDDYNGPLANNADNADQDHDAPSHGGDDEEQYCGKELSCGIHRCDEWHYPDDECETECEEFIDMRCLCGEQYSSFPCDEETVGKWQFTCESEECAEQLRYYAPGEVYTLGDSSEDEED